MRLSTPANYKDNKMTHRTYKDVKEQDSSRKFTRYGSMSTGYVSRSMLLLHWTTMILRDRVLRYLIK